MNLKLTLEYDGTGFCGWQVQPGQRSVQGVVEEALLRLTGHKTRVHAAGRTDAGVHALGQVISFALDTTIPAERFHYALNPRLPPDVKAVTSEIAADDFHARFSAKAKTYYYHLLLKDTPSPLYRHRAWQVSSSLNLDLVQAGLRLVEGTHDFRAFCAAGSSITHTERTIYQASLSCQDNLAIIAVHGNGFLYNMVRIIVGSVVAMGQGRLTQQVLCEALHTGKRSLLMTTAPPHGLYLARVDY